MTFFRAGLLLMVITLIIASCKQKKKPSMAGEETVEVSDFIEFFSMAKLPFIIHDSVLQKKDRDSLLISQKVFSQFVPDSVLTAVLGKGSKPKIYPIARIEAPGPVSYLFIKAVTSSRRAVMTLAFDKKNNFIAPLTLLRSDASKTMQRGAVMDRSYSISKTQIRRNADGTINEGKDVYALNADAKKFTLIMTDALDDKVTELVNPIDTLSRKHKLSADYSSGKMNLVSIRDGRRNDRLTFFIHFEKNNGECTGELKGEAQIKSTNLAEYRQAGDPCVLQFRFSSSAVTLKEIEGCGSRRGLRCAFDGSYAKKREVKPKTGKSKTTSGK